MSEFRVRLLIVLLTIVTYPGDAQWQEIEFYVDLRTAGYCRGWYFFMTPHGLYRTDDPLSPSQWQIVSPSTYLGSSIVAIDGHLFTKTLFGYINSTDLGSTWSHCPAFPPMANEDSLFSNDRYLFILRPRDRDTNVKAPCTLFRSMDRGVTWEQIEYSAHPVIDGRRMFAILPSGRGFAQGADNSLWESWDHGATWRQVSPPSWLIASDLWVSRTGAIYRYDTPGGGYDWLNKPTVEVSNNGGRSFTSLTSDQAIAAYTFADAGNEIFISAREYGFSLLNGDWTRDGVIRRSAPDFWGRTWQYVGAPFDHQAATKMITLGGCVFAQSNTGVVYAYRFLKTVTDVQDPIIDRSCRPEFRRSGDHTTIINSCEPCEIRIYNVLGQLVSSHQVPTGTTQLEIGSQDLIMTVPRQ